MKILDPRISIIIPTYNRPDQLNRAIRSILNQHYQNFEIIIVDDGSETDTLGVVEKFDDSRLTYIKHDTNRGGSAARNTGISSSRGEFIAFLDDDDEWEPEKLQLQIEYIENKSDDWVGVFCQSQNKRENSVVEYLENIIDRSINSDTIRKEGGTELIADIMMKRFRHGGTSTLMIRTETINQIGGFDESYDRHQDIEFLIRLLKTGKLGHIDKPLVTHHHSSDPTVEQVERSNLLYLSSFTEEILELRENGDDVLGVQEFWLGKIYLRNGNFFKGIGCLLKATIPRRKDYFVIIYSAMVGIYTKLSRWI